MEYFVASAQATPATTMLTGRLSFSETPISSSISPNYERLIDEQFDALRFPAFSIDLISDDGDLIPVDRNIISTWPSGSSYWDVVVGTGTIWKENEDNSWNRASLPLTLVSRREGQARICIVTFAYQSTQISNGFVQCSQEGSPSIVYEPGDMRAQVPLSFSNGGISDINTQIAKFRQERATRLPVKNWSQLPIDDPTALAVTFNRDAVPLSTQSYGALILDGVLYQQTPETRHGPYPYPDEMRHGVHSITKSISGSLALLYFAQRYGDEIFDAKITDYVPDLVNHPGWKDVTFEHTINMVSGTEGRDINLVQDMFSHDSAKDMISAIAQLNDAASAPGASFNYATVNYFVLSYALQEYVAAREGVGINYWDLVQHNVLDLINVYEFPKQRSLELTGAEPIPTLGVGAFPTADDAAKIALLFDKNGAHNGMQILHPTRTREALNRTGWPGFPVDTNTRYQHSFWRYNYVSASNGCPFSGSAMQGLGGNYIELLPSGVIILRFIDNESYSTSPLVEAAEKVRPSC